MWKKVGKCGSCHSHSHFIIDYLFVYCAKPVFKVTVQQSEKIDMFRGTSAITLDSKSRITIPTKYREELLADCQGQMVCTVDIQHPCLLLYPLPEWEEIELKLCNLSSMNPQERLFQQLILGNASDCEMDKNGRLLINGPLRQHASLEKNVILVGQLKKFEIWHDIAWQAQMQQGISKIQSGEIELTERLLDLSL